MNIQSSDTQYRVQGGLLLLVTTGKAADLKDNHICWNVFVRKPAFLLERLLFSLKLLVRQLLVFNSCCSCLPGTVPGPRPRGARGLLRLTQQMPLSTGPGPRRPLGSSRLGPRGGTPQPAASALGRRLGETKAAQAQMCVSAVLGSRSGSLCGTVVPVLATEAVGRVGGGVRLRCRPRFYATLSPAAWGFQSHSHCN